MGRNGKRRRCRRGKEAVKHLSEFSEGDLPKVADVELPEHCGSRTVLLEGFSLYDSSDVMMVDEGGDILALTEVQAERIWRLLGGLLGRGE